ncbi:hypothetical protein NFI96_024151 [Prochilodus magdalenae]|nr:hypothetical protein NFI96_024151 [Prochilodus magdalenae]
MLMKAMVNIPTVIKPLCKFRSTPQKCRLGHLPMEACLNKQDRVDQDQQFSEGTSSTQEKHRENAPHTQCQKQNFREKSWNCLLKSVRRSAI